MLGGCGSSHKVRGCEAWARKMGDSAGYASGERITVHSCKWEGRLRK